MRTMAALTSQEGEYSMIGDAKLAVCSMTRSRIRSADRRRQDDADDEVGGPVGDFPDVGGKFGSLGSPACEK
jgi:hypothetical protein